MTLLPFSLVGPFTGVLIDRWSRRRVLVVMSFVRAALTLAALATVVTHSQAGAFVGILLLLSTSRFVLAAKGAALPGTVDRSDLVTANAVSAIGGMSASFLGAIGGSAFVGHSAAAGLHRRQRAVRPAPGWCGCGFRSSAGGPPRGGIGAARGARGSTRRAARHRPDDPTSGARWLPSGCIGSCWAPASSSSSCCRMRGST